LFAESDVTPVKGVSLQRNFIEKEGSIHATCSNLSCLERLWCNAQHRFSTPFAPIQVELFCCLFFRCFNEEICKLIGSTALPLTALQLS